MSKRWVAQVCQLAAAILHLGNIGFEENKGKNEEAAIVSNTDVLEIALNASLSWSNRAASSSVCAFLPPVKP
jgi:myosin heavy subunit